MKTILQFLANILLFIMNSFFDLIGVLWTGKLPKISIYHKDKLGICFNKHSDKHIPYFEPDTITAKQLLDAIYYSDIANNTLDIYNKSGEVIGESSIYGEIFDIYNKLKKS